jgi:hypothetical protein
MIYRLLDIFFVLFHTSLIIFNLFGWIWKKARRLNLITLVLTGSSWLFLGMIVGTMGYCPVTDLHFKILEKLEVTNLPVSYIKYLVDRITGLDVNPYLVDKMTLYLFLVALLASVIMNTKDVIRVKLKNR